MRTLWMSVAALILAFAGASSAQTPDARAAVVNGETVTLEEVTRAAVADIAKLDANRPPTEAAYARARLEILHAALGVLIENKLLAAEAAKRGVKLAELIAVEIESNIGTPTTDDLIEFYEANKAQIPVPRDQALPQIKDYLMNGERNFYRNMLLGGLKKTLGVKVYLDPIRTEVATAGFPSRGRADAPVTIVEFADFECPHCGTMFPVLNEIEKAYPEKVRMVYRQFPLTRTHPHAQKAAEASLCANAQERFGDFHASLFRQQGDLTVEALKRRAVELKLDTAAFNACLDTGKQAGAVKQDIEDGAQAGVTGTPALFINGRKLSGTQPYNDVRDIIEDELQRQKTQK